MWFPLPRLVDPEPLSAIVRPPPGPGRTSGPGTRRAPGFAVRVLLVGITLAVFASCSTGPGDDAAPGDDASAAATSSTAVPGPPTVVVTTDLLADITTAVLSDQADVAWLVPRDADPSTYVPTAAQAEALRNADLVVHIGLGFEGPALDEAIDAAGAEGVSVLEIGPSVGPLPLGRHGPGAPPTAAPATGPATPDPHVWLDPDRVAQAVKLIGDEVSTMPGVNPATITRLVSEYRASIATADEEVQASLATIPEAAHRIAATHDALGYFADRYGFIVVDVLVPAAADDRDALTPTAITDHATTIRDAGGVAVVTDREPASVTDATAVANAAGGVPVVVLDLDGLGPDGSGATTYLRLLTTNARTLSDALT